MASNKTSSLDKTPVFVLGMPRSGTTILGKIIDRHSQTYYLHEPDIAKRPDNLPIFTPDGKIYADEMARWIDLWVRLRHPRVTATIPVFRKAYRRFYWVHLAQVWVLRVAYHAVFSRTFLEGACGRLLSAPPGRPVIKSVNLLGRVSTILNAEPKTRIVHVVRHPCGQVASVMRSLKGNRQRVETSALSSSRVWQALRMSEARLAAATLEERLAWKWLCFNEEAMLSNDSRILTVRYEDIIIDPDSQIPRIARFLGLDNAEAMTAFLRSSFSQAGNQTRYSLTQDPQRAVNGWKNELTVEQQARIQRIVRGSQAGALYLQ